MAAKQTGNFSSHSMQDWISEIKKTVTDPKELEKLIWKTENGFHLNVFYNNENTQPVFLPSPGKTEFRQLIYADKIMAANQAAQAAVKDGADSLYFKLTALGTENEINALLKNLDPEKTPLHFDFEESNVAWLYMYVDYLQTNQFNPENVKGSINYDPMSEILLGGNFIYAEAEAEKIFQSVLEAVSFELPQFKIINVNAFNIRECGGNQVQEIAVALAMTVEYMNWANKNGIEPKKVFDHIQFHLSAGNDHLLEISKLRAFRILIQQLAAAYGINDFQPQINSVGMNRNKTIYSAENNIIRSTLESLGSVLGGANSITLHPHDDTFRMPEKSYKTTRDILKSITRELSLSTKEDLVSGSYYLENLTKKISEISWDLFLEIDKQDGYIACLKNKFIQQQILTLAEKQQSDFMSGELSVVAVNVYLNKNETKTTEYTRVEHSDLSNENRISIPLKAQRISEKLEFERMKKESTSTIDKN